MNWYAQPTLLTWLLVPFALLYGLIIRIWHLAFDLGLRRAVRVEGVKIISVGNLVVGGAGKTPVVIHLANEAVKRGHKVAVLTRGYGRKSHEAQSFTVQNLPPLEDVGDEPRLIARRCPAVTVFVGTDRVALAQRAKSQGFNLLILDDGFQHRRLARDIDLLVDAGLGNGWMMPAGPLREPASGRKRATHVWGRDGTPGDIQARHVITRVLSPEGEPVSLEGKKVVLLLGVARPDLVQRSVTALGASIAATHAHPDHHVFTATELEASKSEAKEKGALLVTTEKDAERLPERSAHVLVLDVEVLSGTLPLG